MNDARDTKVGQRAARVLLVDDYGEGARLLQAVLELEGYEVEVATTADEAFRLAEALRPDAVVLDLLLGDATGYEILGVLRPRACARGARFVAFTGKLGEDVTARCLEAGFDHHVVKSTDVSDLLAVLPPARVEA